MVLNLWCRLWMRLQDAAFWVDDYTHTAYAGNIVTRIAERVTPNDY